MSIETDPTLRVLLKTREILKPRNAWGQGRASVDGEGINIPPHEDGAVRFCLLGATRRAVFLCGYKSQDQIDFETFRHGSASGEIYRDMVEVLGFQSIGHIMGWNDDKGRSKRAVLARIDRAIKKITEEILRSNE